MRVALGRELDFAFVFGINAGIKAVRGSEACPPLRPFFLSVVDTGVVLFLGAMGCVGSVYGIRTVFCGNGERGAAFSQTLASNEVKASGRLAVRSVSRIKSRRPLSL